MSVSVEESETSALQSYEPFCCLVHPIEKAFLDRTTEESARFSSRLLDLG
jgi:hypothetical protein